MTKNSPDNATNDFLYEVQGGIGYATLNRPSARNALTISMYDGLAEVCRNVPHDGSVKAIVISGTGDKAFAAGTDISHFREFTKPEDGLDYEAHMDKVFHAIETCPVTTISVLHGACTGGGAAIAVASDIRIAAEDLKFGIPIARTLGNCLSARNLGRFAALMGKGRAMEMMFTSRLLGAQEVYAMGLVTDVLDDKSAALAKADELANQVGSHAPLTLRSTKEAFRRLSEYQSKVDDSDLIVQCYMSEDFREGMDAFLAKRAPQWKGR
ncbi:MAG: enoyl-CoA hydratase/isomerase family protein [Hyphomicrobiaceae bacterium]